MAVKVFKRKSLLANEEIYKPTRIVLDQSKYGDRFVIKIEPTIEFEPRQAIRIGVSKIFSNTVFVNCLNIFLT